MYYLNLKYSKIFETVYINVYVLDHKAIVGFSVKEGLGIFGYLGGENLFTLALFCAVYVASFYR
ncbi:hypothetical protein NHP190012_11950 [Helicobacter sp. NHP19-012]|uniref:Uncharacterized protein n=1 Tax=Helicobacter gastrofelis TaxID=2849642 RepID=A0ABN6I7U3_9HELI|nr:hypothetical protein [Helicobacter sp. NHP22-001]BCZ19553.1 hypothetical protein NHP190012_11950 [Helicobacter sp. NHP19-012]GMB96718.1 hypothetical protein NHP22001_13070 [Helicobacter sp. NHP22-001]